MGDGNMTFRPPKNPFAHHLNFRSKECLIGGCHWQQEMLATIGAGYCLEIVHLIQ